MNIQKNLCLKINILQSQENLIKSKSKVIILKQLNTKN